MGEQLVMCAPCGIHGTMGAMARMSAILHLPGRVGLCTVLMLASFAPGGAVAEDPPMSVTTDTLEYCLQLHGRVDEMVRGVPTPPPELTSLATEGQRLCEQGQLRGGILRLRRALMLLLNQQRGLPLTVDGSGP
jgi:hypothetical protein